MLSDKVIIVVGGGHGLGECAQSNTWRPMRRSSSTDLGFDIHGDGVSREPSRETVEAVKEAGGEGMDHFGDIRSTEYTEELVAEIVDEYGRVDGTVNFAGILNYSLIYNMTDVDGTT